MSLNKILGRFSDVGAITQKILKREPYAFSFNVSDRCPVGCLCYWRAQERVPELSPDDAIAFFHQKKREGYIHATLVGGEPYVRRDLLPRLVDIVPLNWIVTSATTPLMNLRATHFVSVDGPNADIHDKVRRMPGLYNRILKHLDDARDKWGLRIYIHSVLNKLNKDYIHETAGVWQRNGLVDGIMFSTMTPIRDAKDDSLRLTTPERIEIVDQLLQCKGNLGDFICMTPEMIDRLHPNYTKNQTPAKCGTAVLSRSFYADGRPMPQCILSDKADCSQCGCVVTTLMDGLGFSVDGFKTLHLGLKMSVL